MRPLYNVKLLDEPGEVHEQADNVPENEVLYMLRGMGEDEQMVLAQSKLNVLLSG